MKQFDTFLIGRKTFDAMSRMGNSGKSTPGIENIVISRTLQAGGLPANPHRGRPCAPGERTCAPSRQGHRDLRRRRAVPEPARRRPVDRIEMSLIPVLLGGGIPLLPPPAGRAKLVLRNQRVYAKTGTISLEYDIVHGGRTRVGRSDE
jgi:dihydrofolate reductase